MNYLDKCKEEWKDIIFKSLKSKADEINRVQLIMEIPPQPEMGDIAFPMFPFAKYLRTAPQKIAEELAGEIKASGEELPGSAAAMGPYVNIFLKKESIIENIINEIINKKEKYGITENLSGRKIMCEAAARRGLGGRSLDQ